MENFTDEFGYDPFPWRDPAEPTGKRWKDSNAYNLAIVIISVSIILTVGYCNRSLLSKAVPGDGSDSLHSPAKTYAS